MDQKDFDAWNERKKRLHGRPRASDFFQTREVWWCALGLNVGVEMDGKYESYSRPVLILRRFNKDMFWGIPFTTTPREGYAYVRVTHAGGPSWAILNQLKTMSSKRLLRRIDLIPSDQFRTIRIKTALLLKNRNPPSG